MKKWIVVLLTVALIAALLSACGCSHEWEKANCEDPETCSLCGETQGEPEGHDWQDATCTAPKTCKVCGETEGDALAHTWVDADCLNPKTCSVCGETEGDALGHVYDDAAPDCENPKLCGTCGEPEAEATEHVWVDATTEAPKTCSVCGKTEGDPLPVVAGVSTDEFVAEFETYLNTIGGTLSYSHDYENYGYNYYYYDVLDASTGESTEVYMYCATLEGSDTVISGGSITYYTDYDHSYLAGEFFAIAALILDETFDAEYDTNAMVSATPETDNNGNAYYTYEKSTDAGIITYLMQITAAADGTEMVMVAIILPE